MDDLALLAGILVALLASAGFSGAETVFLTLDRIRLHSRAASGDRKTTRILYFVNRPERFVISTLTGNNLANVIYSSLIALLFQRYGFGEETILLLSPLILLIFSESLPKAFSRQFSEQLSRSAASYLHAFWLALWPLNHFVEWSIHRLEQLTGVERDTASSALTRSDFTFALTDAAAGGNLSHQETRWIKRLMNLSEKTVSDMITPRNRTATIRIDASVEEAIKLLSKTGHKRLVCVGRNEDDLLGVIRGTDLLKNPSDLQSILRPVPIVPESLPLIKLVDWLKKQKTHFALAIDEYGGFAGIVTLNDLASELVGPIHDRYAGEVKECVRLNDHLWIANGSIRLNHLADITGFEAEATHANSLGGLLVEIAGGIPVSGDEFSLPGVRFRVLRSDNQGIRLVRLALTNDKNQEK